MVGCGCGTRVSSAMCSFAPMRTPAACTTPFAPFPTQRTPRSCLESSSLTTTLTNPIGSVIVSASSSSFSIAARMSSPIRDPSGAGLSGNVRRGCEYLLISPTAPWLRSTIAVTCGIRLRMASCSDMPTMAARGQMWIITETGSYPFLVANSGSKSCSTATRASISATCESPYPPMTSPAAQMFGALIERLCSFTRIAPFWSDTSTPAASRLRSLVFGTRPSHKIRFSTLKVRRTSFFRSGAPSALYPRTVRVTRHSIPESSSFANSSFAFVCTCTPAVWRAS
mmetsp:Transcript_57412/g.136509  ORF Transcript_57412/g.136509 Transcript_57412/m.136509 type:complete len:283 (-) Transcript_57412:339-1187(-)